MDMFKHKFEEQKGRGRTLKYPHLAIIVGHS